MLKSYYIGITLKSGGHIPVLQDCTPVELQELKRQLFSNEGVTLKSSSGETIHLSNENVDRIKVNVL